MSYHNTTNQTGEQLDIFSVAAKSQDEIVLQRFKGGSKMFSPSAIHHFLIAEQRIAKNTPITSIRRSITNLTKKGKLIKTKEQTMSLYGRPEYVWKLK